MKKLLLGIAAACLAGFTFAQDAPLWMRHSVISPDGTTIAFTYKGHLYGAGCRWTCHADNYQSRI